MTRDELLRRLRDPRRNDRKPGLARRSLEAAIIKAMLVCAATLHGVTALAVLLSLATTTVAAALAVAHLAMAAMAIAVPRIARGELTLVLGSWALFVADWTLAPTPESTMLFAACWLGNLTNALPVMLLSGRRSWQVPLLATIAMPLAMVLLRPEWVTLSLLHGVPITLMAMTVATRIGVSYLVDYTDAADAEAHALEERSITLSIRKAAIRQAAEDARVLHDTAINTLAAIASGGAAIHDAAAVRNRCLADIATIDALRTARRDDLVSRSGLRDAIHPSGIRVRHVGLSGQALIDVEARLPTTVVRAFSRAAAEAVQNAAKHSGADEVEVAITATASTLQMDIRDTGIGMRETPGTGYGVARSILERTDDAGIQASIDSAPGRGTCVRLTYDFAQAQRSSSEHTDGARTLDAVVSQLHLRAVFALSAGLVGVGITLAALNHPGEATPEWLMVVVVALACGLAWRERSRPRLSVPSVFALIGAGPLAFVLSAWAVGFGLDRPYLWQAIGPTGPLLVLLIAPLPRIISRLGYIAYGLTVVVLATIVARASPEAARVTLVAGGVGLGLVASVLGFMRNLADVASRAHMARRERFELDLQMAAIDAAAESRLRWRNAGLDSSLALLRAIALGTADPGRPEVQQRCADEEAFLRQLSLLDPELVQMGSWFARALNASRQRGIGLTVRAGAADAAADDAHRFGESLLAVVDTLPSGTPLTTALFSTTRGLIMTLVAPTPNLAAVQAHIGHRVRVVTACTLGQQDLLEIAATGAPS